MLKLIRRNETYLEGYKAYCQEFKDHKIETFKPMDPDKVTLNWFINSMDWYQKRELGQIEGQHRSICLWAVDGQDFIGEFQLRLDLNESIKTTIGSIGYSVKVSAQGLGYGKDILKQGLAFAKKQGLDKVILLIAEENYKSQGLCEMYGGIYLDTIMVDSKAHRRYWIDLEEE